MPPVRKLGKELLKEGAEQIAKQGMKHLDDMAKRAAKQVAKRGDDVVKQGAKRTDDVVDNTLKQETKKADSTTNQKPIERYNRQKHYGGSQTDTPATKAAKKANEGKPCPNCGQIQRSGTNTAPSPQHEPALSQHYYDHGGHAMSREDRIKHAQESINGTQCLTCQRREGAKMSRYSKKQAKKHGL